LRFCFIASRCVDEGVGFALFTNLSAKYGQQFYSAWPFFKVKNSDFLNWLSIRSGGVSDNYGLTHFVIKGANTILDVVASYEPEFKVLE